jgi:hypothetical protein
VLIPMIVYLSLFLHFFSAQSLKATFQWFLKIITIT